jgi:hypothetical protein
MPLCDTIIPIGPQPYLKSNRKATIKKIHKSKNDVAVSMKEMDSLYKTTFSNWIRSESNLQYICTFKSQMLLKNIEENQERALYAFEWMVEDWSTESVAEFILKLFYKDRIWSLKFAEIVYGICKGWSIERTQELLPVLLVGEKVDVCAKFFGNFLKASCWGREKMIELIYPITLGDY